MLPPGVNAEMFELLSITVSSLTLVIVVMVIVAPVAFIDLTARLVERSGVVRHLRARDPIARTIWPGRECKR